MPKLLEAIERAKRSEAERRARKKSHVVMPSPEQTETGEEANTPPAYENGEPKRMSIDSDKNDEKLSDDETTECHTDVPSHAMREKKDEGEKSTGRSGAPTTVEEDPTENAQKSGEDPRTKTEAEHEPLRHKRKSADWQFQENRGGWEWIKPFRIPQCVFINKHEPRYADDRRKHARTQ